MMGAMGGSTDAFPFELVFRGKGMWRAHWREEKLRIAVAGTEDAPDAALMDTLRDLVSRWSELELSIAAFVRGLDGQHHVPLDPAEIGGFAAKDCGFGEELAFDSMSVTAPQRATVTFYTGYPDGYAAFKVMLEHGAPVTISAYAC